MEPASTLEAPMGPAESLADRLNRLVERRRQAAQRPHSSATSSDGEAEAEAEAQLQAGQPPQRKAVQALRQLLQQRGSVFYAAITGPADGPPPARRESGSSGAATVGPSQPPTAPAVPELADASLEAAAPASGGSVPPTARLLISLSDGIGREEVQAERQLRTAEQRDADAAVRDAEVGCCCSLLWLLHRAGAVIAVSQYAAS
jgi:hypothetical protein